MIAPHDGARGDARKRHDDPAALLSQPIPAPVDSGAIGRLTDAQCAEIVRASIDPDRVLAGLDGHEGSAPDVLLTTVQAIVGEHTDRALAEVEQRIKREATSSNHALRIVRAARQEQGR